MTIKKWFARLIHGSYMNRITQLMAEIDKIKQIKQLEINKVNAYWKTREYNQQQRKQKI